MSIHSFSIRKHDTENDKVVQEITTLCIRNGISFSHVVLEALKLYKKEKLDVRPDLR